MQNVYNQSLQPSHEVFTKEAIVERFSDNARKHARVNHDADQNYYRLIHIYREIMP